MSGRAQFAVLPDGRRHFHDGPIDLVIEASGAPAAVRLAYAAAARRFATVLDELCAELPLLRAPAGGSQPEGSVARRMADAAAAFAADRFLTPMATVAGAVAQEILSAMTDAADLERAYVNNGGDIALHLAPDASFVIGLIARPDVPTLFGKARIGGRDAERGIATSGWRGRSFSLGVADAVTVIAEDAAHADAAATLIANAVDLPGHPAVARAAAQTLDPQSDLGDRLVTTAVGPLGVDDVEAALDRGEAEARRWIERGLVAAAALRLCDSDRLVGRAPLCGFERAALPPRTETGPRHAVG